MSVPRLLSRAQREFDPYRASTVPVPNPPGVDHWFRTKLGECRSVARGAYEGSPLVLIPNPTDACDMEVQLEDGRRLGCIDSESAASQAHIWLSDGKAVRASIYSIDREIGDDGRSRPCVRVLLEFMSS